MKAALVSLLALEASVVAARNVVHFPIAKPSRAPGSRLSKRAKTVTEPLTNEAELYVANVTVGTPGQALSLQIDTGSSDVWMVQANAPFCVDQYGNECVGGTFDPSKSTSYSTVSQGTFQIQYVDETGVAGDYFSDAFSVGPSGQAVTVKNFTMGLARNGTITTGIMGVGFANDESICNGRAPSQCKTTPTLPQTLVSQGFINSQAYSLWLNDLDSSTGNILFGGIDTAKFKGKLITLPVQPDSQTNSITSFTVAWTNLTLGTPTGELTGFVANNFVSPAILDSGTTLTLLPGDVARQIYREFGATYDRQAGYLASCDLASSTATFDFSFGGAGGPTIRVPVSEFLLPVTNEDGSPVYFTRTRTPVCQIGIEEAGDNPILFGDTFLRSAYVVYDLDNKQVSLAQTVFNATDSNVLEIKAGTSGNVPSVAGTATGATVRQTETRIPGFFGSLFGEGGHSATAAAGGAALSSQLNTGTGAPLAQYTAANTNNPIANPGGSGRGATSSAGAMPGRVTPGLKNEGIWMGLLLLVSTGIGSAVVLL